MSTFQMETLSLEQVQLQLKFHKTKGWHALNSIKLLKQPYFLILHAIAHTTKRQLLCLIDKFIPNHETALHGYKILVS